MGPSTFPYGIILPALALLAVLVLGLFIWRYFSRHGRSNSNTQLGEFDNLFLKIRDEIHTSVTPYFVQVTPEAASMVELAVEIWRIEQRVTKAGSALPENFKRGTENSIMKFRRFLEKYDIEIIDYTGQKYNDGLNLDITAVEKDPSVTEKTIKETVEPAIICRGRVIKKAKVVVLSNEI